MPTLTQPAVDTTTFVRSSQWDRYASHGVTVFVILAALYNASTPLLVHASWMLYLQDDCFYYLKVAQNLASGHGSTFNGIVPTNGYHPLWLLVLTCFRFVLHDVPFIRFIAVAVAASTIATYFLACRLMEYGFDSTAARNALAGFVAVFAMPLYYTGMEVILTIPLVLLFLWMFERANLSRQGMWHAFGFGLLASAMVLSRIDSILLVMLLAAAVLVRPALRRQITRRQIAGLLLGMLPVALYFAINHHFFGTWIPVSGMAKQLKTSHLPSSAAWHSLYIGPIHHPLSFIPIAFAVVLLPFVDPGLSERERVIYPVVLAWPFLYVLMLSCVSDWMLWNWYFYPLRPALCVAMLVIARWVPMQAFLNYCSPEIVLIGIVSAKLATTPWTQGDMGPMVEIAERVQLFAITHPGVYAMGDRSGSVGYLLPQPLVQTEGLMMDRGYLEAMRHTLPLSEALHPYRVRFYIATEYPPYGPCYHVMEPAQAGPASPHLTGDLCNVPLAVFNQEASRTAIYDMDGLR